MSLLVRLRAAIADPVFTRAALTSALATGSDFVVASLLSVLGLPAGFATFIGCVVGGLVSFRVNRRWAFQARSGKAGPQLARFLFVWAASALLNALGVALVVMLPSVRFGLAWIAVRGVVYAGWNYPMLKLYVFARSNPPGPQK